MGGSLTTRFSPFPRCWGPRGLHVPSPEHNPSGGGARCFHGAPKGKCPLSWASCIPAGSRGESHAGKLLTCSWKGWSCRVPSKGPAPWRASPRLRGLLLPTLKW